MKDILFIGHDAGRSGAPLVLLHFMRWLKRRRPELSIDLVLLRGGPLEEAYRQVAEVFVVPANSPSSIGGKIIKKLVGEGRPSKLPPFKCDYKAALGNTVASLEYLVPFHDRGIRTICWVHEMEYAITSFQTPERFAALAAGVDYFIAASRAVEASLKSFGVEKPAEVVYEFSGVGKPTVSPAEVRAKLGIAPDCFLVGGGGTIEWRKGFDLFLQIAAKLSAENPKICFVWIGGRPPDGGENYRRAEFDLERMGLRDIVRITGITATPEDYLAAIDVFALTSREDPFPLMCLEAAGFAKPIVCFAGAGGMPEFVEADAGSVVPYGDPAAFAEAVEALSLDKEACERAGQNARGKLSSARFSAENSCLTIERLLLKGSSD